MKTYLFYDINSSITISISAYTESQAWLELNNFLQTSNVLDNIELLENTKDNEEFNSLAYDEGFDEKSFGKANINNNPYSLGTENWRDWVNGFKNGWND